jgi:hypothetical protein
LKLGLSSFVFFLLLATSAPARGDVGLILSEATPRGMSKWTNAGHSAVYLSRVCAASPVKLRLCGPDEQGSVISNYIRFQEDQPYEWNVVPFNIFLYGVEDPNARPLYGSVELRRALQERFRQEYLGDICSGAPCTTDPEAHWRDMVAESFARGMYIFVVKTTLEQDRSFIAKFNTQANINRYNGFTNNCADFASRVVNFYFPRSARSDHMNDFGMTSPKAISKSFAHFAARHPKLEYRVIRIPQMPGSLARSSDCRKGTEVAFRSKRWLLPMLLKGPHELVLFATSYMLTGRFNPQREFQRHPAAETGSHEQWSLYRNGFVAASTGEKSEQPSHMRALARDFDARGTTFTDSDGSAWVQIPSPEDAAPIKVGVSVNTIAADGSDPQLAYRIISARVRSQLETSAKHRESLAAFALDWSLFQELRTSLAKYDKNRQGASPEESASSGTMLP